MCLRLTEKETIDFLTKAGIKIHPRSLSNIKNKIKRNVSERVNTVYDSEMLEEHFIAIDTIKLAQKMLWQRIEQEKDPYKRAEIIIETINQLPFLTEYYKSVKHVLRQHKTINIQQEVPV
jgi:hypothetical protein